MKAASGGPPGILIAFAAAHAFLQKTRLTPDYSPMFVRSADLLEIRVTGKESLL